MGKQRVRTLLAAVALGAGVVMTPVATAPTAQADQLSACQTTSGFWFLKGTRRTICDGVRRADGSWLREREFWTPEYYKPMRTSCYGSGYITCSTYGGYWVNQASNGLESYVVFDHNVLQDEPGHLE